MPLGSSPPDARTRRSALAWRASPQRLQRLGIRTTEVLRRHLQGFLASPRENVQENLAVVVTPSARLSRSGGEVAEARETERDMVQVTYPGVYIQELSSGVRTIATVATSIAAFVDYFAEGPMNEAVRIQGMGDFERLFGGLNASSAASYGIAQFF